MSRATTLPAPWYALAAAFGGVGQLAEACGVGRVAVYRWANRGVRPGRVLREHVNALARARGIEEPFSKEGDPSSS